MTLRHAKNASDFTPELPDLGPRWPRRAPDQVAFVVPDIGAAIRNWSGMLAVGEDQWRIYTYSRTTTPDLTYRGRPAEFSFTLAMCGIGPQIELIENQYGESIYSEWSREHGAGIHHLGWFVDDLPVLVADLAERGIPVVQSGSGYGLDGDGGFAYVEVPGVDITLELISVPARRRPTESIPAPRNPAGSCEPQGDTHGTSSLPTTA